MIDRKPAVGRLLLRESGLMHGFVGRGGVITKISGSRIYYQREHIDGTDAGITYVSLYTAICDTREEYDALLTFEKKCLEERCALYKKHKKDFDIFIAANNAVPDAHDEPINPDFQYIMDRTQIPELLTKQHGKLDDIRSAIFYLQCFNRIPEDGSIVDQWGFGLLPYNYSVVLGDELRVVQLCEANPLFDHWMTREEIAALDLRNEELRQEHHAAFCR